MVFLSEAKNLAQMSGGKGDSFFKVGAHHFLAIFEVDKVQPANVWHFGIVGRSETQLEEVKKKLTEKYKVRLESPFRRDFLDPIGKSHQVVDLHDEIAPMAVALWRGAEKGD